MSKILFSSLVKATFIKRINRFIAEVLLNDEKISVHVPSTGRLDGVLDEGISVYLKPSTNKNRKTKYSLYLAERSGILVCVDALVANDFAFQLLSNHQVPGIENGQILREIALENERIDFVVHNEVLHYIEVKSVNKVDNGIACFPDAPTERGRKHLSSLIKYQKKDTIQSHVIFVVQRHDAISFSPCKDRDPEFASLLYQAHKSGVKIHVCLTNVTVEGMFFEKWLDIHY